MQVVNNNKNKNEKLFPCHMLSKIRFFFFNLNILALLALTYTLKYYNLL